MHKTLPTNPSLPLYLLLSSSYLALQSILLLLSPRLIVTLLANDTLRPPTTDLESYLCRALAWSLLAISGFGASCAIALGRENEGDDAPSAGVTSATGLILPVTLLYHTTSAIQVYVNYSSPKLGASGGSGFLLHAIASGILCVYGVWVLVFGSQVRVSSVDGRDKRVSGFLFGGGKEKEKGL